VTIVAINIKSEYKFISHIEG